MKKAVDRVGTVLLPALVAVIFLDWACGSGTQEKCEGAERCDCYGNGTCDDGLVCRSNACVSLSGGYGGSSTVPGTGGTQTVPGSGGQSTLPGSGGNTVTLPPASPNCTDVSSTSSSLTQQGSAAFLTVAESDKQYVVQSNWWHLFKQQILAINGLSFTVLNPTGAASSDDNPMGYPSLFIGSYAGRTTKSSNLPKQVASLTKVNTVFSTNATSFGTSNYNAAYDVWFTATGAPLPATQYTPGPGGAYLMVWLFNPIDRQPRGAEAYARHVVAGISGSWNVWIDNTDPPCISYVSTSGLGHLDFDLNAFIQDAVTNRYGVTPSMYLSIVFAGFEIWGGGNGLQAKAFCANVL
jgi:hypothetical protein